REGPLRAPRLARHRRPRPARRGRRPDRRRCRRGPGAPREPRAPARGDPRVSDRPPSVPAPRSAVVERRTSETRIRVELALDPDPGAAGPQEISTGLGFLDHMLAGLAKHAGFGLSLTC